MYYFDNKSQKSSTIEK